MIRYIKNLFTSFLIWIRLPKIGKIHLEQTTTSLEQNVRINQDVLEVNLDEWTDTIKSVFETDNFAVGGLTRVNRPSDEVLKKQIQLFFKDYSRLNKKVDELYTKTLTYRDDE